MAKNGSAPPKIAILAPTPVVTVTIEAGDEHGPEIHYHAGGQGVWVARMAANLGAEVVLCTALGGESGELLGRLLQKGGIEVRSVPSDGSNGSYIHDRRGGNRVEIAVAHGSPLGRHAADALFGMMLAAGLEADVAMLTGPQPPNAVSADFYRRLATDLRANDRTVVADVTRMALAGCLSGGVDLLKLSEEELGEEPYGDGEDMVEATIKLNEAGAAAVVLSRGPDPALVLIEGALYEVTGPYVEPVDRTGTGDSMFAAIAVALAQGRAAIEAVRLGAAAGALNATRRGLGTGRQEDILRLLPQIAVREIAA